jgi:predicted nucleotidyltransferase
MFRASTLEHFSDFGVLEPQFENEILHRFSSRDCALDALSSTELERLCQKAAHADGVGTMPR